MRNLDRWTSLIDRGDVPGLHRVLTGLDRDSIEMREVSPMGGLFAGRAYGRAPDGQLMRRDTVDDQVRWLAAAGLDAEVVWCARTFA